MTKELKTKKIKCATRGAKQTMAEHELPKLHRQGAKQLKIVLKPSS